MKKTAKKAATTRAAVKKQSLKDLSVKGTAGGVKGGQLVAGGSLQVGVLDAAAAKMIIWK